MSKTCSDKAAWVTEDIKSETIKGLDQGNEDDFVYYDNGRLRRIVVRWSGIKPKNISVTYVGGYAANDIPAVIKNTLAIEVCVNSIKTEARDRPIILANNQNVICAAETDILDILALR